MQQAIDLQTLYKAVGALAEIQQTYSVPFSVRVRLPKSGKDYIKQVETVERQCVDLAVVAQRFGRELEARIRRESDRDSDLEAFRKREADLEKREKVLNEAILALSTRSPPTPKGKPADSRKQQMELLVIRPKLSLTRHTCYIQILAETRRRGDFTPRTPSMMTALLSPRKQRWPTPLHLQSLPVIALRPTPKPQPLKVSRYAETEQLELELETCSLMSVYPDVPDTNFFTCTQCDICPAAKDDLQLWGQFICEIPGRVRTPVTLVALPCVSVVTEKTDPRTLVRTEAIYIPGFNFRQLFCETVEENGRTRVKHTRKDPAEEFFAMVRPR